MAQCIRWQMFPFFCLPPPSSEITRLSSLKVVFNVRFIYRWGLIINLLFSFSEEENISLWQSFKRNYSRCLLRKNKWYVTKTTTDLLTTQLIQQHAERIFFFFFFGITIPTTKVIACKTIFQFFPVTDVFWGKLWSHSQLQVAAAFLL